MPLDRSARGQTRASSVREVFNLCSHRGQLPFSPVDFPLPPAHPARARKAHHTVYMGGKRETRGSTLKIISSDFPHKNRCGFFTHAARHLFFDTLAVLFQARAQQPLLLERLGPWMRLLSRIAHLALPLVVLVPYASSSVQASCGATAGKNKILCTVDNNGRAAT